MSAFDPLQTFRMRRFGDVPLSNMQPITVRSVSHPFAAAVSRLLRTLMAK